MAPCIACRARITCTRSTVTRSSRICINNTRAGREETLPIGLVHRPDENIPLPGTTNRARTTINRYSTTVTASIWLKASRRFLEPSDPKWDTDRQPIPTTELIPPNPILVPLNLGTNIASANRLATGIWCQEKHTYVVPIPLDFGIKIVE